MAMTTYTGVRNGFIQDSYPDYMGKALPGLLYSPADYTLTDAYPVSETGEDGLVCGRACVGEIINSANPAEINNVSVRLPKAGDTKFEGVVVRTQHTQTNAKGQAAIDENNVATIQRNTRQGGRIWVEVARGNPVRGEAVYVIVNPADPNKLPFGAFVTADNAGDAVLWDGAVWAANATEGDITLIEMGV